MSDLLVIEFPTEAQADEVRQKLLAMQNEYLIELGDAVVVDEMPRRTCQIEFSCSTRSKPVRRRACSGARWSASCS